MRLALPSTKWPNAHFSLYGGERIVERVHKDAAHHVDDEQPLSILVFDHPSAPPRRAEGKIDRTDQTRLAFNKNERFALIEGVVAERHRIDAAVEEFLENRFGQAEAACGVLAVDDD